jgi:putative transposase
MTYQVENSNKINEALECLMGSDGLNHIGEAVQMLLNHAMKIEQQKYLQAGHYQRTEQRQDYANGYKPKQLNTRLGRLALSIPQVRNGDFYPSALERGIRSEKALKVALAEMYIQGVSTRKVKLITEQLCGFEVSSQQVSDATKELDASLEVWRSRRLGCYEHLIVDALYEKVREGNSVISESVLIAYGVDDHGQRRVLGASVSLSEAEVHWRAFFQSLLARGLHGVKTITSDAHTGLNAAIRTVFPGVEWQRCQFHLQQNAQKYVPKIAMRAEVAETIKYIFRSRDRQEADRLLQQALEDWKKTAPSLGVWAEEAIPEGLTVLNWSLHKRKKLRTSNMAERVNKEIRRRTKVVGIFPNAASCLRLISAILVEEDEGWMAEKAYLSVLSTD